VNRNAIRTIGQIVVSGSALLSFALPNQTHAQFTGNNQTNVISGVITNWPTLNVGNQRSGDSLIISNAANVFSSYAYVGQYGSNNGVQITGSGSLWSNANNVYIGAPGSANRVTINDQGRMLNGNDCYIGYTGIYSNIVLVSGNG
jgi:T5SS/PEP-CTERM-associated repeat protein